MPVKVFHVIGVPSYPTRWVDVADNLFRLGHHYGLDASSLDSNRRRTGIRERFSAATDASSVWSASVPSMWL
jgi:hypothetical protein